jgi:hypothetical protein
MPNSFLVRATLFALFALLVLLSAPGKSAQSAAVSPDTPSVINQDQSNRPARARRIVDVKFRDGHLVRARGGVLNGIGGSDACSRACVSTANAKAVERCPT